MPYFFFDYCDDEERDEDTDGIEFPNIEAAYLDAYHSVIDIWAEARHEGRDVIRHRIVIRDTTGSIVMELPFGEVLGAASRG
jgi:hypothetical protein